jgi:glycosyltransferase involved in cell wall biosynthesis
MKRIWFVSHYSMPPKYEMRIKTQMYAHFLKQKGCETKIFSASTIHNTEINLITDDSPFICCQYDDLDFVHIKCHSYSGNGLKRIRNMLEFSYKFKKVALNFPLPDVIVADVNCINYEPIYKFCAKHNIRFFIDMRDLWPMSIVEYYGYSESNPIICYLYLREKKMYKRADGIIFSMEGGRDYIREKGWDKSIDINKFHYINNGVDLAAFYQSIEDYQLDDSDLNEKTSFKIVYTGSIRVANNLKPVVEAAKILSENGYKDIVFFIYGDGDDRENLERYCKTNRLENVNFKGFVEKKYIPYILSKCDLSILNYKNAKTLRFGGSQNKLFEYMAAGKPVIVTVNMNYNAVTKNNCGIALEKPTAENIAEGILKIYSLPEIERIAMGKNAKQSAKEYDFKDLSDKLFEIITSHERTVVL